MSPAVTLGVGLFAGFLAGVLFMCVLVSGSTPDVAPRETPATPAPDHEARVLSIVDGLKRRAAAGSGGMRCWGDDE